MIGDTTKSCIGGWVGGWVGRSTTNLMGGWVAGWLGGSCIHTLPMMSRETEQKRVSMSSTVFFSSSSSNLSTRTWAHSEKRLWGEVGGSG